MHKQSPVPECLPFCPLCLLTGLLWAYHSNLNYFVFFSRAHTNRELQEDGPPNKLEENRHYQTNRTLGLSKQAWERHDGVPVCDGDGWVPMRWQRKSQLKNI